MIYIDFYKSPIGYIRVQAIEDMICNIDFVDEEIEDYDKNHQHPLLRMAITQLEEYFSGKRIEFSLPLGFSGTEFQNNV